MDTPSELAKVDFRFADTEDSAEIVDLVSPQQEFSSAKPENAGAKIRDPPRMLSFGLFPATKTSHPRTVPCREQRVEGGHEDSTT